MKSWPFDRDGVVARTSLPVKNSPLVAASGRRRPTPPRKLSRSPDGRCDDVMPDVTSSDAHEYGSDVAAGDYDVERRRTSTASVMRPADVDASSPVNSSGIHIVIDDDYDDVTYADDESTSGLDAPSADAS